MKKLLFNYKVQELHTGNRDICNVIYYKITDSPLQFYNTILPIHCIIPPNYRILFDEVIYIIFIDFDNTRIDRVRQRVASCLNVVFWKGIDVVNHIE
ncbi:hypothetical protein Runsl_3642 [Runella slithyformis DSM 19594]|uniref:Uncharacterized protein n=1 Tax=Runella slithyformis (strain ATCC 29530 / DSM 19594 / LMG 11500 / NCIMB 11436 / LSU 4) TaxID=761193 RepID=A0A7U3ZML3_RUNSL|nr:hypothetical protein Runsl_3642 [Runella slithyformis DSM 19594]